MAEQARTQKNEPSQKTGAQSQARGGQRGAGLDQAAQTLRRAQAMPQSLTQKDVLQLQRAIGNRATGQLLQAKFRVGPAGDVHEQEADRTARQVMRTLSAPASKVQREEGDETEKGLASPFPNYMADVQRSDKPAPKRGFSAPKVQRSDELDEDIQAKPTAANTYSYPPKPEAGSKRAFFAPQVQRQNGTGIVQSGIQRKRSANLDDLFSVPYPNLAPAAPISSPSTHEVIQRAWHTYPLNYATMSQEKTQGQIRTKAWKRGGGLEDWVTKFHTALGKRSEKDALKALNGLKARLIADQKLAAQGKLKAPKGVKNFNLGTAQQNAAIFFAKWILSVQEHIDYATNTGDWITDFREKYINEPLAANLTPKEAVLRNLANVDRATDERLQGIGQMWDLGSQAMQQRMTDLMGGVSDLPRMSGMEYFLEQASPEHVGYGRVLAMFDQWTTGVLYHNWTYPWETWMQNKSSNTTYGQERIIDSYDPLTRAQYELTPNGKTIRKADNNPLVGDNIYVLTKDNLWYGGTKDGPVHHSSFMQGAPVKCAGHLHTDNGGNLKKVDISSGHYAPGRNDLRRAAAILKMQMDVSDVKVSDFNSGGLQSVDDFLKS